MSGVNKDVRQVNKAYIAKPIEDPFIGGMTSVRRVKSVLRRVSREVMEMAESDSKLNTYRIRNSILTELAIIIPTSSAHDGDFGTKGQDYRRK